MTLAEPDWLSRAIYHKDMDIEIGFFLTKTFFIGDGNQKNQFSQYGNYKPVSLPDFSRKEPNIALTSEVIGHEKDLTRYYKSIIDLAHYHRKKLNTISHYFWLRLEIQSSKKSVCIHFPKYEFFSDMQPFLEWLKSCDNNSKFSDYDQELGWEFEALCLANQLYFRISDPYDNNEQINITCDKDSFLAKAIPLEKTTLYIINILKEELGVDMWSTRIKKNMVAPNSGDIIAKCLFAGYRFLKRPFQNKAICILIILACIASSFIIYQMKNYEKQKIEKEHAYEIMIERAAVKKFDSVKRFLKVAPGSFLFLNEFSEIIIGKKMNLYSCKLPQIAIINEDVVFNGSPTFHIKPLFRRKDHAEKVVNIEEMEIAIEEERKK